MIDISGKEALKTIRSIGGKVISQKGSHVKVELHGKRVVIPLHSNKSLSRGVIKAIEKQLKIKLARYN